MNSPKIIFISLQDSSGDLMLPQHNRELAHYLNWLRKTNASNPVIISPCTSLCLRFSQKLSEDLNCPLNLLSSLSSSPPNHSINTEHIKTLPDSLFPQKIDPLFSYILSNHDLAVILIEASVYSTLKLSAHNRLMDLSCYHEIVLQDEKTSKFQINTVNEFESKILEYIEDKTNNKFEDISGAFKSVRNKLDAIPEEVKTISKALNSNYGKSQREFLRSVEDNNRVTSNLLERSRKLLNLTNYYKKLADFYIMSEKCSENARVRISSVKLVNDKYQLKIVSECDEDLKQVQVLMCENRNCIARVKVLQRRSTVFLDVQLEDSDFFTHLVVVSGDSVVSEPFVLFPLRVEKHLMYKNNKLIKVTNLSDKEVREITVASTQCIENIMHLPKGLLPRQSIYATIPESELNKEILLISENQQFSNLLILPS